MPSEQPPTGVPVARLAFRPFFLLAAAFSCLAMVAWYAFWHGNLLLSPHGGTIWWHQHEMIFGFAAAVVVGFLLTAVQNWTGRRSLSGAPLLGLAAIWLAARLLLAFPMGAPDWLLLLVDVAFLPLAAIAFARPVLSVRQWRNAVFIPTLLLLAVANMAMHLGAMHGAGSLTREGSYLGILLIALLMVQVGGRVIPLFTSRRLGRPRPEDRPGLERLSLGSMYAVVLLQLAVLVGVDPAQGVLAGAMLIAGSANAVRLARWDGVYTWREPLLWSLHLSYAFMALGLILWAVALTGAFAVELALHTLAIGGIAAMMLSMMARVSLGHTGREIRTLPGIGGGLGVMFLAAALRSPIMEMLPQGGSWWAYDVSIFLWCAAYLAFLSHYAVPLLRTRADGKDG